MKIKEIKYLEDKKVEKVVMLCEPSVTYNYGQNHIHKYHDKIFKELFSYKKEAIKFINKYLQLKGTRNELKEDQVEKRNTEFITKQKEQLETDILYKIKGKNVFVLIEQQSKVDYFMVKRILYYYVEIMREMEKELRNDTTLPIIYPIVLYTGKTKWTAKIKLEELQEGIFGVEKALNLSYRLVDVNSYTKEELRKERSSIAKAMLMEKIRNREELIEELEKVVKEELNLEEQKFIVDILNNIAIEEIGEEKAKELREKIEGKVEDTMVMENLRSIFRMNYNEGVEFGIEKRNKKTEYKNGIETGMQTATYNFVRQMLKNRMSEKTIIKITKISKKELEKIKEEINSIS